MANPNQETTKVLPLQKTVFNLDEMEEVTLLKDVPFVPVTSAKEAEERLGNSTEKFLEVINDGLAAETRRAAINDPTIPWLEENEDGTKAPFTGTIADTKVVNALILNLAKSIFGYVKDAKREVKKGAKEQAMRMIKDTDAIREGLKKNAALKAEE